MVAAIKKSLIEFCKKNKLKFESKNDKFYLRELFIITDRISGEHKIYVFYYDETYKHTPNQIASIFIKDIKKNLLKRRGD